MNNIPTPRTEAVMVDPLSDGNDLPQLARKLETELSEVLRERDEAMEALDCLLAVIGLTPIAGNREALQDAFNQGLAVLRKWEETK